MDAEPPPGRTSGSLSVGRAVAVLVGFVVAVAVLVAVGTRPSVSSTAPTPTTTPTTAATTSTTAAAGASTTATTAKKTTTTTTEASHKHKGGETTTTTVPNSSVSVVVANATSTNGLAAHYTAEIGANGWSMKTPIDAATTEATSAVYYAPGFQAQAEAIASSISVPSSAVAPLTTSVPVTGVTGVDVVVVLGQDLANSTTATTAS